MKVKDLFQDKIVFPFLIIVLIITRFIFIENFFYFGVDEEYQALLGWSIVKNFHVLWIGVSASNTGYYLGPGLVYLSAILLWINKNPIIFGYFASFIGVLTAISLYYIVRQLYNRQLALISFILYIFSPYAFYYDRKYWPLAIPLVALWLFYSLIKSQKNSRWLLLTAFLIGLSYHIHITLWLFWPFIIYALVILFIKKRIKISHILASIFIFIIITFPLLVFDFVHNFDNLKLPLKLISIIGQGSTGINILSRFNSFIFSFSKIFFITQLPNYLISLLLFFFFVFFCIRLTISRLTVNHKKNFQQFLSTNYLLLTTILFFFSFLFFPSPMQEYYFVFILPFAILLTAIILNRLNTKLLSAILIIFALTNIYSLIKNPINSDYKDKITIISEAKNYIKKNDFVLEIEGEYLYNGGWRYLFQANGLTPAQSSADELFGWIYPDEISKDKPKYKVTISRNTNLVFNNLIKKISSGIYHLFIIPNY